MRIAMLGTRGVPAHYGGFETAVEEIGSRLAAAGHDVTVYCRGARPPGSPEYLGMTLVHLPAVRHKALETLSHTALSTVHAASARRFDAAVVFNSANAVFAPLLRTRGIPFAVHVDGLEWKRAKWGGTGRRYYRVAEALAVRWSDALIADAEGIADYYAKEFGVATELLTYGAPIQPEPTHARIGELRLEPAHFHLAVARFEPENHIDMIVAGYRASRAKQPLVVVGAAPYSNQYTRLVSQLAEDDDRVRLVGPVWDQDLLDELYSNCLTYVHGHSVGGTNPSLLRAMGAGAATVAYDVSFNREVAGEHGVYFGSESELSTLLQRAETDREDFYRRGEKLRDRARFTYRWDHVAAGYADLLSRLSNGESTRGSATGRRSRHDPAHVPR